MANIIAVIIILLFALLLSSCQLSILYFFDQSSITSIKEGKTFIIAYIEIIIGILFTGFIISIITERFISLEEKRKIKENHSILLYAFENHIKIKTRNLLKQHNFKAKLRYLDITNAEIRLEISKEDIIKTVRQMPRLRLRLNNDKIVLESFLENSIYGTLINSRNSNICIIATQAYSDLGIGHFSYSISENINSNYISNELFSSGAPLKKRQINFVSNEAYVEMTKSIYKELNEFIRDLKAINNKTDLFVYMSVYGDDGVCGVKIRYNGKERNITDNISTLKHNLSENNISLIIKDETETDSKKLTCSLKRNFQKPTCEIYLSTGLLRNNEDKIYYQAMFNIKCFINQFQF